MTKPLTHPDTSTNLPSLKMTAAGKEATRPAPSDFLDRAVARFWAYTEKTGEADTLSFNGLL